MSLWGKGLYELPRLHELVNLKNNRIAVSRKSTQEALPSDKAEVS